MGDFNEVRRKSERFGSAFNVQGADMFNTFIANAGLEEIPLGGSSFTWCHKSATKMSKLDRFLISENLFNSFLDICAISLDRFLSDHRPILLRESNHDYGKIPFRYFNHWAELDGFNTFVINPWEFCPVVKTNAMRNVDAISMADSANDARKTIVSNLQRELEAEATLANTMLGNLTRYSEQMRIREIQITMLQNMPTMSLNSYGLHALLMTHEADIRTTNNLIRARQELLRSIAEKQNFINNYKAI
ncbi:RNA-directed DNA polymerase, eukaryota [Tanacetum coccineum]